LRCIVKRIASYSADGFAMAFPLSMVRREETRYTAAITKPSLRTVIIAEDFGGSMSQFGPNLVVAF